MLQQTFSLRRMSLQKRVLTFTIVLLAGHSCALGQLPQLSLAQPNQAQHQMVLLKNGRILKGAVTRDGEDYLVAVNPQSYVRLRGDQVEFSCRDLQDAYATKRYLMNRSQANEHIAMAEWCLQHKLRQEAADHLLTATSLEPYNKRLPGLERRWRMLQRAATTSPKTPPAKTTVDLKEQQQRELTSLPDEVVRQFTTTIQPILLNNCGTSGCHGKNSDTEFHLRRPSWGPAISRGLTQRNLQNTLARIDRQTPAQSRLLSAATQPHANLPQAVFSDPDSVQLKVLTAWLHKFADIAQPLPNTLVESPQTPNPSQQSQVQQVSQEEPTEEPVDEKNITGPPETLADDATAASDALAPEQSGPAPRTLPPFPSSAETSKRFAPKDAFDAEIFNRRQGTVPTTTSNG